MVDQDNCNLRVLTATVTPAAAAATDRSGAATCSPCSSSKPIMVSPSGHTYRLGRVVGVGSYSLVRIVTDEATGKEWACKRIPVCVSTLHHAGCRSAAAGHAADNGTKDTDMFTVRPSAVDSVRREIAMLSRCQRHRGVVQLRETFTANGAVFIITELVTGVDLLQIVASPVPVCEKVAREIMRQLLHILKHIHSLDVAHRDIKLENLLVTPSPDGSTALKLIDFGLSDQADPSRCGGRSFTEVCGTLHSVAPEVLSRTGSEGYGKECDVWSAGVTMFALLCGEYPFGAADSEPSSTTAKRVVAADYKLDAPGWISVSEDAKHLLRMMLEPNSFLRVTAEEALQHSWFLSDQPASYIGAN